MEEFESEIISNNKKISSLLKENEELLKKAGYLPPGSDWEPAKDEHKIHFHEGYIRPNEYFIKKYKLNVIVCDKWRCGQKPRPESGTRRRSAQTCILMRIG